MDWAWIPITLAAAFFQAIRTALQKYLKGSLSTNGSTLTRFLYGAPFALLYLLVLATALGKPVPPPTMAFLAWIVTGALAQIVATALLIHVLGLKNFPVGVAYTKTEIIQAAIFGAVVLGDPVTGWGVGAILIATFGVMLFSMVQSAHPVTALLRGWLERPALLGMLSGSFFSISAIAFRAASLSLPETNPFLAASTSLAWANCLQTLLLGLYIAVREPGEWGRVLRSWRISSLAGISSVLGSACWFTAMAIQVVAYVRTLGLVELILTFLLATLWFKEKPRRSEIVGVVLLAIGIVMILNRQV